MSNEVPGSKPSSDEATLMVVDLLDAIGQCGSVIAPPLEERLLSNLQRVSACESLPEPMRALAGRLVADHLARTARPHDGTIGQWRIH